MDSFAVHPLQSAEIILRVGQFISLWIPSSNYTSSNQDDSGEFEFKPKDLLNAIAVNSQFQRILTPLLWAVFNESVFNPRAPLPPPLPLTHYDNADTIIPRTTRPGISIDILNKYSPHFRFLECLRDYNTVTDLVAPIPRFQFTCSNLQELFLSCFIEPTIASQLIQSNPNLTVLQWSFPDIAVTSALWAQDDNGTSSTGAILDLKSLFGLRRLKSLTLEGWAINPLQLRYILENNADHLQDLVLTERCYLDPTVGMNISWLDLCASELASMTDLQASETSALVSGRRLLPPKLKLLCLDIAWARTCPSIYSLANAFPGLEALMIHPDSRLHAHKLFSNLREFCPHLSSVQCFDERWIFESKAPIPSETMVALIRSAAPGNLVDFRMGLLELDDTITDALLTHKDALESLELVISGDDSNNFRNMARILQQCSQLRKLGLSSWHQEWNAEYGTRLLLEDGGMSWACRGLETCVLNGFSSNVFEEDSYDEDSEDSEDFSDAYHESNVEDDFDTDDEEKVVDEGVSLKGDVGVVERMPVGIPRTRVESDAERATLRNRMGREAGNPVDLIQEQERSNVVNSEGNPATHPNNNEAAHPLSLPLPVPSLVKAKEDTSKEDEERNEAKRRAYAAEAEWIRREEKREQQRVYLRCALSLPFSYPCTTKAERDRDLAKLLRKMHRAVRSGKGLREHNPYCRAQKHRPVKESEYMEPPQALGGTRSIDTDVAVGLGPLSPIRMSTHAGGGGGGNVKETTLSAADTWRVLVHASAPVSAVTLEPVLVPVSAPINEFVSPAVGGVQLLMVPVRCVTPDPVPSREEDDYGAFVDMHRFDDPYVSAASRCKYPDYDEWKIILKEQEERRARIYAKRLERQKAAEKSVQERLAIQSGQNVGVEHAQEEFVPKGWEAETAGSHHEYDLASAQGQVFRTKLLTVMCAMPCLTSLTLNERVYQRRK